MALLDQIQKDMMAAMKAKEELRLSTLRMVKAALQRHQVDTGTKLDEGSELKVLASLVKQRQDSVEMYRKGGRDELADKEQAEIGIIQGYMPSIASEEELTVAVEAAVTQTGADSMKQMGAVMKAAKDALAGKTVDGRVLSELVKKRLGG